jgi:hypothetical protein
MNAVPELMFTMLPLSCARIDGITTYRLRKMAGGTG